MRVWLASLLLLCAVWLAGVASLAVLPPFEGFDETAHWSYIQQFADELRVPVFGQDRLAADVYAYPGPMASPLGQPYRDYFRHAPPAADVARTGPTRFTQGRDLNWQAQHPPLFYVLMALPYRALARAHWPWHMLGLRLVSWTLAFAGFAWGALLTQRLMRRRGVADSRLLLPLAWPILFAEFFPEFARLTNDGLCILVAACVWWLVLGWLERGPSWRRSLALGATLGAGLLTKAFFLPVTAGVALLLAFAALRTLGRRPWPMVAGVPLLAALIGGWWYLMKLHATGTITGSLDLIELDAHGGVIAGVRANFNALTYLRGAVRILASFCSAGTWSFAHLSRVYVAPVVLFAALPTAFYLRGLRPGDTVALAPAFIAGPVLAGLLYHQLGMVAATGEGSGTPGWYLHIFAAPLSLILVLGWGCRVLLVPLLAYASLFSAMAATAQVAFFSGCLPRAGVGAVTFADRECLYDVANLRRLALPDVACAAAVPALLALLAVLLLVTTARRMPVQAGTG